MTSVLMRFPDERLATFTCSFGAADVSRYTLIGTKGSLTAEPAYDYSIALKHQLRSAKRHAPRSSPNATSLPQQLLYFSECILQGCRTGAVRTAKDLADVRIVRAIYESARTGRMIELAELPPKKKPTMRQEIHRPAHGKPKMVNAVSPSGE